MGWFGVSRTLITFRLGGLQWASRGPRLRGVPLFMQLFSAFGRREMLDVSKRSPLRQRLWLTISNSWWLLGFLSFLFFEEYPLISCCWIRRRRPFHRAIIDSLFGLTVLLFSLWLDVLSLGLWASIGFCVCLSVYLSCTAKVFFNGS